MNVSGAHSSPARAGGGAPSAVAEPLLYDEHQAIERLGLKGKKTGRWLLDKARADQIPFTPVGKTLMWSDEDLRDIVALLRHKPRNKFQP